MSNSKSPTEKVPIEIWHKTALKMKVSDIYNLSKSNKTFYNEIWKDEPFWKKKFAHETKTKDKPNIRTKINNVITKRPMQQKWTNAVKIYKKRDPLSIAWPISDDPWIFYTLNRDPYYLQMFDATVNPDKETVSTYLNGVAPLYRVYDELTITYKHPKKGSRTYRITEFSPVGGDPEKVRLVGRAPDNKVFFGKPETVVKKIKQDLSNSAERKNVRVHVKTKKAGAVVTSRSLKLTK